MQHSMFRLEMLKEGRSIRLPILLIFYDSILAFVTILFIFFNNESMQVGYYSGQSSFVTQFLIITSIQILAVFVFVPFLITYLEEADRSVAEQFLMIPGAARNLVIAKIHLILAMNILIFLSSLPIISLSCIYSGISLMKIIRLMGVIVLFAFWSGSIALFFYSLNRRSLFTFAGTIFAYIMFSIGLILLLEILRSSSISMSPTGEVSVEVRNLCLILNLFNPLSVYIGYFENIYGNLPMITSYFGNFGIDVTNTMFSYLYFKISTVVSILTAILFLYGAIRFFSNERKG